MTIGDWLIIFAVLLGLFLPFRFRKLLNHGKNLSKKNHNF